MCNFHGVYYSSLGEIILLDSFMMPSVITWVEQTSYFELKRTPVAPQETAIGVNVIGRMLIVLWRGLNV